ncbi:MAG: tetratricopeptide repeat protein [Polyangiaceae bacterium]|nr:tetratricopeptide repeat protein [Polyangiaceae bacterium]
MAKNASRKTAPKFTFGNVSTLLADGMAAHQRGDLEEAARNYQRVLAKQPRHPDALHLTGVVARQRGDLDIAVSRIREAIAISPNVALYHANLGRALGESGDTDGCIAALERALKLDPTLTAAAYNLGIAFEQRGDAAEAERYYRVASEGDAALPEAAFNLGNVLVATDRIADAVAAYHHALELRPGYTRALANLGNAYQKLGRFEDAAGAYKALLEEDPDDAEARHMLAALTGESRDRADASYVARFFDDYAARFEKVLLEDLRYDTPAAIAEVVKHHLGEGRRVSRALDLGCGTGLAGRALRPFCDVLIGVDLSPNMLEKARAAGGYDELHADDLIGFLQGRTDSFDLFVASDVLNYLGDLLETFQLVARRAASGALFVFSTEAGQVEGFHLDRTGRFSHGRAYVEATAASAGLDVVSCDERVLRLERDVPVHGHLFLLRAR